MPFMPSTTCTTPGCKYPVPYKSRSRKCEECRSRQRDQRPSAEERGYTPGWDEAFLRDHPVCLHQIAGKCTLLATLADHFPKSRKQLRAEGVPEERVNDPQYLLPSCEPCHNYVTSQLQPGGWNRPGYQRGF